MITIGNGRIGGYLATSPAGKKLVTVAAAILSVLVCGAGVMVLIVMASIGRLK